MVLESLSCIPRKRKRKYKNLKNIKNAEIPNLCSIGTGDGVIIDEDWKVIKALQLKEVISNKDHTILRENVSVVDKSVGSTEVLHLVDNSTLTVPRKPLSEIQPPCPPEKQTDSNSSIDEEKRDVAHEKNATLGEIEVGGLNEKLLCPEPLTPSFDDQTDALTREVLAAVDVQQVSLLANIEPSEVVPESEHQEVLTSTSVSTNPDLTSVDIISSKSPEPVVAVKDVSTTDCAVQTDDIMISPTPAILTVPSSSVVAEPDEDKIDDTEWLTELIAVTERELPRPRPRRKKRATT